MRIGIGIQVGNHKKVSGEETVRITVFPTALVLTYNGNAQTLITAGEGTGVMLYKLDNGEWSENLPQAVNAGGYTVYYKCTASKGESESKTYRLNVSIAKVTPTLVAPTPKVLTYNTNSQEIAVAGSTDWGVLKYSLDGINWGTSIPTAVNAGVYTLYYRVDGNDNINSIAADSILAPIAEKRVTSPTIVLSQDNYTYNGSACEPTPTVYDGSVIIPSSEYTVEYANNINAGTATVIISDVVDGNYYVVGTTTFSIVKANASCTAPTAKSNLVYSGSVQSLVDAGTASGGTMYYSLDNENWSTDIPTATNAGDYTIYYKVIGDSNHNDSATASVSNSIAKANRTLSFVSAPSSVGEGDVVVVAALASAGSGDITYSSSNTSVATVSGNVVTGVSAGTCNITASIAADVNYNAATAQYQIAVTTQQLVWIPLQYTRDGNRLTTSIDRCEPIYGIAFDRYDSLGDDYSNRFALSNSPAYGDLDTTNSQYLAWTNDPKPRFWFDLYNKKVAFRSESSDSYDSGWLDFTSFFNIESISVNGTNVTVFSYYPNSENANPYDVLAPSPAYLALIQYRAYVSDIYVLVKKHDRQMKWWIDTDTYAGAVYVADIPDREAFAMQYGYSSWASFCSAVHNDSRVADVACVKYTYVGTTTVDGVKYYEWNKVTSGNEPIHLLTTSRLLSDLYGASVAANKDNTQFPIYGRTDASYNIHQDSRLTLVTAIQ